MKMNGTIFKTVASILVLASLVLALAAPVTALAKRGHDNDNRSSVYGIIEARPDKGLHGRWVIGGRSVKADAVTEFDQAEGKLEVGGCAKVHFRNGRVHEIDSEPMRDCP